MKLKTTLFLLICIFSAKLYSQSELTVNNIYTKTFRMFLNIFKIHENLIGEEVEFLSNKFLIVTGISIENYCVNFKENLPFMESNAQVDLVKMYLNNFKTIRSFPENQIQNNLKNLPVKGLFYDYLKKDLRMQKAILKLFHKENLMDCLAIETLNHKRIGAGLLFIVLNFFIFYFLYLRFVKKNCEWFGKTILLIISPFIIGLINSYTMFFVFNSEIRGILKVFVKYYL